jgi:hypothetical protein
MPSVSLAHHSLRRYSKNMPTATQIDVASRIQTSRVHPRRHRHINMSQVRQRYRRQSGRKRRTDHGGNRVGGLSRQTNTTVSAGHCPPRPRVSSVSARPQKKTMKMQTNPLPTVCKSCCRPSRIERWVSRWPGSKVRRCVVIKERRESFIVAYPRSQIQNTKSKPI